MAAITPSTVSGGLKILRSAQTTTLTDWVSTPPWAQLVIVHLRISVAGTNTILTLKAADPVARDDAAGNFITFLTSATITATGYHTYTVHPFATAAADQAAADAAVIAAAPVPALLGITITPTGSTYSTYVEFRGTK
jgi:hypothetical protein